MSCSSHPGDVWRGARRLGLALCVPWLSVVLSLSCGCRPAEPEVLCKMKNPKTGRSVSLYQEIWYKRPRDYDEKRHLEQWKEEQQRAGFTIEIVP
jgi:hypothetical protein